MTSGEIGLLAQKKNQNELFIPCCSPYLALSSGACGASICASGPEKTGQSLEDQVALKSAIKLIFNVFVDVRNSLK